MTTLVAGGSALTCSVAAEDSQTLGYGVAVIEDIAIGSDDPSPLFEEFDAWCDEAQVRLVSCRLDHLRLRESMALEDHGFRFVEMVYRPRLARLDQLAEPEHPISILDARRTDLPVLQRIAATAFTTGRLALDPRIGPELSGRRYANWIASSMDSAAQQVLTAQLEGKLVGFFILEHRPGELVYWHLTAVAPETQGRGIGMSLWRTMLLRHRAEGATSVETTVSGHNPPVLNLYARLGFAFTAPQLTLHLVRGST